MSAHLYPGIKSLHLILDTPYDLIRTDDIRDDIIGVKVWYSDTSGFDPAAGEGTLIFDGLSLSVTIPSLLANTRYYVRYAFISSIDPTTYTISAELTELVYDENTRTYGYLTNTPTAIATDVAGEGGNFSLATGIFKVYNLSQDVTGNGTVYSIKPGSVNHVLGASIDATTGVYRCTGMDANTGSVTFLATYGDIVIELVWNLYKGIAGANAPLIQLSATNSDFIFKDQYATVSLTPQTDITANLVNITGTPIFTAIAYTREGNTLGNVTFTQNGNSITITGGQFAALGTSVGTVQVTATLDNISDTYTLYRINDGTEQITVELTNVAHVIPAANNGDTLPANYVGSGTTIKVKQGNTYLNVDPTTPTDSLGTWNIFNITSSNITCDPTPTIGTDYIDFDTHAAMTADQAYIDYTIVYRTTTGYVGSQIVRQSFAKSREGVVGSNNVLLTLFRRTTTGTAPSVSYTQPTSTYNFKLGTITGQPDGWTLSAPTNAEDPYLWVIQLSISSSLDSYTFSNSLWPSTPTLYAKSGTDGPYVEISGLTTVYRNSGGALTPTNISLTAATHNISSPTYSWSVTGASPSTATGVSITITPDGIAPVAVTLTVSGSNISAPITLTRTMAIVDQGVPGQAGANGVMSAYPTIYRWVAGTTPPARPTTTSIYTWSTGAYTAPTSWSTIAPSNTTSNYTLWQITIPLAVTATTTTSTLDWTNTAYTIRAVAYNGTNGSNGVAGTRTAILEMYQWSATAPTTFPAGTSTYTWATGQFTAPTTTNGWSLTPGTPAAGQTLYVVRQVYADTNLSSTSSINWTATSSAPTGAAGIDGVNGANGQRIGVLEVYQWSATAPTTFPAGTSTYTWATGEFTAPSTPNNWSLTPGQPIPGQTLWGTSVKVSDNLTTPTSIATWNSSTAYALGAAGTNGSNGVAGTRTAILEMYQWSATAPTTFPAGTSTYTWATGQFTAPTTTNGWSLTPGTPAAGQTLYVVRQVYADTDTTTTSSINWTATASSPTGASGNDGLNGAPGTPGSNGQRVGVLEVYKWSATTPTTFPSGTSTYTWATGVFTSPTTSNGWSLLPGAAVSGQTLWGISVRVSDNLTTATSTATWNSSTPYALGAAGTNGTNGSNGSNGLDGTAMYLIDRGTGTSSAAPTATEVYAKLGRYAVAGDIATTLYSSGTASKTWQATTTGSAATWALITTYLSGSLIVQNTITGDKISANTITASKLASTSAVGTDGTFSLDTSTVQAIGKYAIGQFYTTGTTKYGVSGLSTSSSSTAGGILGGSVAAGGFGIGAVNAKTNAFSTFNTACALGNSTSSGYYKFHRAAGDQLAVPNTEVNICTSSNGLQGNYYSESGSYQRLSFYLNNSVAMTSGIFRYHDTSGNILTEVNLGGSTYAVNVPTGKGSSYFGGTVVPFTAAHDGLISDYAEVVPGDIIVDMEVLKHIDISNSIVRMEASTTPYQKGVVGVCNEIFTTPPQDWYPEAYTQEYVFAMDEDISARPKPSTYDNTGYYPIPEGMRVLHVNAIGEGLINVCGEAGNIEKGDLIVTSSIRGKGMLQADDIVRSTTVAKARESVLFDYPTQVKQIACIYMCG